MDDAAFLRQIKIFRDLSEQEAHDLVQSGKKERFQPGEVIFHKGEPGDALAILLQGAVTIPVVDDDGNRRFSAYLGPGDFFGEMALLTGAPRTADVIADGEVECVCLFLQRDVVTAQMRRQPKVARFLTHILGERLMQSGAMREVGKYHLMGELGRGGGGIVYEGFHPTLNRRVAIKMLSHELVYEGDFAERFVAEAKLVAALRHDNIVQVYDCEAAYATFFLVMERLEGVEVSKLLEEGPLTVEEVRHIMRQVMRALQYAHRRGLVHQDIKPSNLFLEDTGRVKLMDFGIASTQAREGNAGVPAGVMGTPGYIAPEVMRGQAVDGRADLYALGVMAYELFTGELPFAAKEKNALLREQLMTKKVVVPERFHSVVPELWRTFIAKATQQDPAERYASCSEAIALFDNDKPMPAELHAAACTVLYPSEQRERVEEVLAALGEQLAAIPEVRVSMGELESRSI